MATTVRQADRERRATPASFSSEAQRVEELSIEAQALLARHEAETAELRGKLRRATAEYSGVRLREVA